jgi:hypothetical protein
MNSSLNMASSSSSSTSTAKSRRRSVVLASLIHHLLTTQQEMDSRTTSPEPPGLFAILFSLSLSLLTTSAIQMLDGLEAPLPAVLPPSPPASRSASPAPGYNKRKQESSTDRNSDMPSKRPRTGSLSARRNGQASGQQAAHHPHHSQPPHSLQPPSSNSQASNPQSSSSSSRPEPEEGELREDASHAVQTPSLLAPPKASVDVPVRRPRRGKLASRHYDALHDTYHNQGRMLKYSGDARFWSTYPPTHREYRPLADPPPINSPYHKHGGLIARLELVDALICFAYSMWNKEYHRRAFSKDTWSTIEAFLSWCKQKWQPEEAISETEKAFLGLM